MSNIVKAPSGDSHFTIPIPKDELKIGDSIIITANNIFAGGETYNGSRFDSDASGSIEAISVVSDHLEVYCTNISVNRAAFIPGPNHN